MPDSKLFGLSCAPICRVSEAAKAHGGVYAPAREESDSDYTVVWPSILTDVGRRYNPEQWSCSCDYSPDNAATKCPDNGADLHRAVLQVAVPPEIPALHGLDRFSCAVL